MVASRASRCACALALAAALGGCDAILGIPERKLDPNLTCGTDVCMCQEGFGSCDGDDANGCETDFATDPAHCGACGRDCFGGGCEGGLCLPVVVIEDIEAGDIAVADGYLYVITVFGEPIRRFAAGRGDAEPIDGTGGGFLIVVRDGTIYWASDTQVLSTPVEGAAASTVLADGVIAVNDMVVGGGKLYFFDLVDPNGFIATLKRVPVTGGPVEVVATPDAFYDPIRATADEERVYWSVTDGTVWSSPHDVLAPTKVADAPAIPAALAVDATHLYWVGEGVFSMPLAGGEPVKLAPSSMFGGISVDATHAYYITDDTLIRKVPLGGGDPVDLVVGQSFFYYHIPVDDRAIYWTTPTGVLRAAK